MYFQFLPAELEVDFSTQSSKTKADLTLTKFLFNFKADAFGLTEGT